MYTPHGDERWSILRCHALQTVTLRDELNEHRMDAWCPMFCVHVRHRHHRRPVVVKRPLLPGFLFMPEDGVRQALKLTRAHKVRQFKLFQFNGEVVTVAGVELEPMKQFESHEPSKKFVEFVEEANRPRVGERAQVKYGPFAGKAGRVLASGRSYSMIELNSLKIQIATCLLERTQL